MKTEGLDEFLQGLEYLVLQFLRETVDLGFRLIRGYDSQLDAHIPHLMAVQALEHGLVGVVVPVS